MQCDITLLMAYIQSGQHLWKQSQLHKDKSKNYLQKLLMAYRKDVERAFEVLQARFTIVCGPAWFFILKHSKRSWKHA